MREAYNLPGQQPGAQPYSEALRVGDWVLVAGQGPVDPVSQEPVLGSIEEQTRLVFHHVQALLTQAGSNLEEVVRVVVHLANMDDYDRFNTVYRHLFHTTPPPVRTTVQSVLWGGIGIEVEVQAYSPRGGAANA